ncbi:MAG: sodium:alanine symporter family protein [Oscillospiraceae bacterium]|nr:sodium:alanine symporter family protein [Oscillospiraceae bacterium]
MVLETLNRFVWGAPALVLILGVGVYLSVRTGFAQITLFPAALRSFLSSLRGGEREDGVSPFQALCTALAATVGTGNLVGVAGAMALGGPGAVFWMWICALLGMAIKFAEATLAVRYRICSQGEYIGGPMYMIRRGLSKRWHWLAGIYSFFGVAAAFGVGNATQINAVITGLNEVLSSFGGRQTRCGDLAMGMVLAAMIGAMLLGGAKRIGSAAEMLVPFAACTYVLLSAGVLIVRRDAVPGAIAAIVKGAFSPEAVTGGMLGSAFQALRIGVSRGVFTNEAGMGTASIAHASAQVRHPVCQGLMGIMEVFLDTIVICTMTALVILVSGVPVPYGTDAGGALTTRAFASVYGEWVTVLLALSLCCFAFATVLGWGLYGARCAQYLFGAGAWKWFALVQVAVVLISAVLETAAIWSLAEIMNGLMVIPNLIALVILSPELSRLTIEYKTIYGSPAAVGGTYENFD